jgi:hypothetical protein
MLDPDEDQMIFTVLRNEPSERTAAGGFAFDSSWPSGRLGFDDPVGLAAVVQLYR